LFDESAIVSEPLRFHARLESRQSLVDLSAYFFGIWLDTLSHISAYNERFRSTSGTLGDFNCRWSGSLCDTSEDTTAAFYHPCRQCADTGIDQHLADAARAFAAGCHEPFRHPAGRAGDSSVTHDSDRPDPGNAACIAPDTAPPAAAAPTRPQSSTLPVAIY
jgi:hypothetical protein